MLLFRLFSAGSGKMFQSHKMSVVGKFIDTRLEKVALPKLYIVLYGLVVVPHLCTKRRAQDVVALSEITT